MSLTILFPPNKFAQIQITIEIQMPRLPARRTCSPYDSSRRETPAGEPSPGLLALKLQRRQAGRLNTKTPSFCYLDFELHLTFELCHLILFGI
jgi:hypothetical protein